MIKQNKKRLGFTLIEVLVVVSILLILTSILIPRLRTISKERNLREAARVTGSIFTQASQRAIADGVAGVLLQYNPNFADNTGFSSSVTNMSLLRAVPAFTGDQLPDPTLPGVGAYQRGAFGTPTTTIPTPPPVVNTVEIPYPIEQEDLQIIKAGDSIRFGQNSSEYSIVSVVPQPTTSPPVLELAFWILDTCRTLTVFCLVLLLAKVQATRLTDCRACCDRPKWSCLVTSSWICDSVGSRCSILVLRKPCRAFPMFHVR